MVLFADSVDEVCNEVEGVAFLFLFSFVLFSFFSLRILFSSARFDGEAEALELAEEVVFLVSMLVARLSVFFKSAVAFL